jgi:hypothetical protein
MDKVLQLLSALVTGLTIGGIFVYWWQNPALTEMQLFQETWQLWVVGFFVDTMLALMLASRRDA